MKKNLKDIETDTMLMPSVIADSVIFEGARFIPQLATDTGELSRSLSDRLVDRANAIYVRNRPFAKKLHAVDGRDVLYMFMRHWLAGIAQSELHVRVPAPFANGVAV